MSHEINLQLMTVDVLAQKCAQETKLFFSYLSNETKYCFELFRRAVSERDDSAWSAILVQYRPSVARWVNRWADKHPDFPLASEEAEDFVAEAFERFWNHFTPAKFGKSQGLSGVLRYLKLCVNSTVSDTWRKMRRRQFDQKLEDNDEGKETGPTELEPTPEELLQTDELWQFIRSRLNDQKEYTVVYASFSLNLSPREIFHEFPSLFNDINEIYKCKANVWARLERNSELRELVQRR